MTGSEKDLQANVSRLALVKKKFTVNITLIGSSLLLVYTSLYLHFKAYFAAASSLLTLLVFVPLILLSLTRNQINQARLLTVFTTVFAVALTAFGLRHEVNSEYYYLPAMMLSLLLFEPSQKNAIAFSLFLPIFAWGLTHLASKFFEPVHIGLAPYDFPYEYFSFLNFIGAFFLTYMLLKFYSHAIQESKEIEIESEHRLMQSSKMASLGQLASGIAHEINNPLSIIIGRTQILKTKIEKSNSEIDITNLLQNLDKIEGTATLIARIVKGLNAFSRDTDNDPLLPHSILKMIDSAVDLCQERLKQHKIELKIIPQDDLLVLCRDIQITQILVNLITNSIDAIEHLSNRWIHIDFQSNKKWVYISVTDAGSGIPTIEHDKLMLPFYSTKEMGRGIGLGLSISKSIAESHNGLLFYDKTSPNTKFTLQLPVT